MHSCGPYWLKVVVVEADFDERVAKLEDHVRRIYQDCDDDVPFHGWHHVDFVRNKATQFARERGADAVVVEAAALVHDLNYVVKKNSSLRDGSRLRRECLTLAGFDQDLVDQIEYLIAEAHTASRTADISLAGSALSDADTLFKALPVTPVVLAHRYLTENGISLRSLAEKILGEQTPLLEQGIYFYDESVAGRYLPWANANLALWRSIADALDDTDVVNLLRAAGVDA